jgi:hypothetical protein
MPSSCCGPLIIFFLEGGTGEKVIKKLPKTKDLHNILRLSTAIFYKPGVKDNVILFDKKPANPET